MLDEGGADDSIGLTGGGDFICLKEFPVVPWAEQITSISIAWGSPVYPDPTLNGLPYTAVLWSDPNGDGDPADAVVLATAPGVISQQGTDTFLTTQLPPTVVTTPNFFVGFIITQAASQFPAAFDETFPTLANRSYVAGANTPGNGNIYDLNDNDVALAPIEFYGLVGNWMIRADGTNAGLFLASAVSRQTHGSLGVFDLPLPLAGPVGIEDRDTSSDTIVFRFGTNIAGFDDATSSCGSITNATIDPSDAHNVLVTIDVSACDQQTITVALEGVQDDLGQSLDTASVSYGKLIGDVNADGLVGFRDIMAVRAGSPQVTKAGNFRLDLNLDGRVNQKDAGVAKQHLGHTLL